MRTVLGTAVLLLAALPAAAQEWERVADEEGVEVSTRESASGLNDLRAVGLVEAAPEHVLAMVTDVEAYVTTLPYTELSKVVKRAPRTLWQYSVLAPPVVSRRDLCLKFTLTVLDGGALRWAWEAAPELAGPARDGVVRVTRAEGSWTLDPVDGGAGTRVTYTSRSDPGGWIPKWMVNRGGKKTALETFRAVRKAVATQYAAAQSPLFEATAAPSPPAASPAEPPAASP